MLISILNWTIGCCKFMSDNEFEKLIKNLRSLKKEIELRLQYKGEVTQFELNLKAEIGNQLPKLGIL